MKLWIKPVVNELDVMYTLGAVYGSNEKHGGGAQQGGNYTPDNPNPNLPGTGDGSPKL